MTSPGTTGTEEPPGITALRGRPPLTPPAMARNVRQDHEPLIFLMVLDDGEFNDLADQLDCLGFLAANLGKQSLKVSIRHGCNSWL